MSDPNDILPPLVAESHEDVTLYTSTGILKYTNEDLGYKLILEIDKEIGRYYRSLIPKWFTVRQTRYAPHVTIVRSYKEVPLNLENWGKYEGEEVVFDYGNHIYTGKSYYWLNAYCVKFENIRLELGLPVHSEWTIPPTGYRKCFHITIGNSKEL